MSKSLSSIKEVYRPKSPDEQRFVDKHVVVKTKDANGNGDDVFKATNVTPIERTKEKHGYNPGEDEKVYEETEQVDEREMSDTEMKKREDYVKGMKKNLSAFKQRYGKDAKSVMYATATKMAKEEVELEEGADAQKRFQEYHNETAKMMKSIQKHLSNHYNMHNKEAHWGHVGDIRMVHDSLRNIHDQLAQTGEYAKEAKAMQARMKAMSESVESEEVSDEELVETLSSIYETLDEEGRARFEEFVEAEDFEGLLGYLETSEE